MSAENNLEISPPLLALLQRGVRWFSDELVARLADAGVDPITPAHAAVLSQLNDHEEVSIAELARRAGVTRQTMHRAVGQLIDEGLLTSKPGPHFPRSSLIELTEAGHQRRAVASRILSDLEGIVARELGSDRLHELRQSLATAWPKPGGPA